MLVLRARFSTAAHLRQRSQRAGPGVNGVLGGLATPASATLPVQPGPRVVSEKALHSCQRQLICLDQLTLPAIGPEPAHPLKIDKGRGPRKMASPPELDNRAFAVITKFRIHAILDAQKRADAQRRLRTYQETMAVKPFIGGPSEARSWITPESG